MYVGYRYWVMNVEDGCGCEFQTSKESWYEYKKNPQYKCWIERI